MLDLVLVPPVTTKGMRIWHSNAESPHVVRQSVIPLQPDASTVQREDPALDEVISVPTAGSMQTRKPGRKQENGRESEPVFKTVYNTKGEERLELVREYSK